MFIIVKIFVMW